MHPGQVAARFVTNLGHARTSVGIGVLLMFFLAVAAGAWRVATKHGEIYDLVPGAFVLGYLVALALVSDLIDRYVFVTLPFMLVQVSVELSRLAGLLSISSRRIAVLTTIQVALVGVALIQPHGWQDVSLSTRPPIFDSTEGREFGAVLSYGSPVFALSPMDAYAAGGKFRILPNDELSKVAGYGRKTGVELLVVRHNPDSLGEAELHDRASWYSDRFLATHYPDLLEWVASSPLGDANLYRFRRVEAEAR